MKNKPSISFQRGNKSFQGNTNETLLAQGESAGLILPYSCLGGHCGRCKAKLVSGEVVQSMTEGLTSNEQDEGYILLCSSKPVTDVEIAHD